MATSKFYEEIKNALVEREVEYVYNKGINLYFPNVDITHPFACDGFVDTKTESEKLLKLIIEYKLDEEMTNRVARAKVILQAIYYMKRFEDNGLILPNVCMIGDKNECFVFHTNLVIDYLSREGVDWSIAPSDAAKFNPDFVLDIANNEKINPFVFEINDQFSFKVVADKIKDLADNVQRYVRVTEHNIANIFDYFVRNVIKNTKKISAHDLVGIFIGVINDKENYYQHPTKANVLVANGTNVDINGAGFKSFFSYFDRTYTPQEKMRFTEIADRLIEDTERRNNGDFWTPTPFVDYGHKMISEQLGDDWKEKFVVWDNCCGTKNLTRDYKFKELYCSTLFQPELDMSERYNQEATSFQFDFLNDSLDKLPKGLLEAFEQNKPIVFLLNPPYATACNQGETSKEGINDTLIRRQMRDDKLGAGAENLQHQFLYRICKIKEKYNLTNVYIAIYSKPIYLSGGKQKDFLKYLCGNFNFKKGVLFQASEFADVSSKWGITFNIWENGKTSDVNNFIHTLVKNTNGEITTIGDKNIYNVWNSKLAGDWVRELIKGINPTIEKPCVKNALSLKEVDRSPLTTENAIGYFHNNANSVQYNVTYVGMYSTPFASAHGVHVLCDNFTRCTALFSARKLIVGDWINDKDEYLAPNEAHEKYNEFVLDSVVYSLFHSASNQSSLRQVDYKGKKWDIKNEFFFMPKVEILSLANDNNNDECYADARTAEDRYVYKYIFDHKGEFSAEAQAVLDKACELVRKSFKYRALFNEEHPEYQINNWDCGWYQIKALVKEYLAEDYKEFQTLYKALADKMRPMVYELGFLK